MEEGEKSKRGEAAEKASAAEPARTKLPADELAFADLVSRELRARIDPVERAALDAAGPTDLERWLAVLERFRDDVVDQLRSRAGRMEGLLQHGSRDLWESERKGYDAWRGKAVRFQNVLVNRASGVRRQLRQIKPEQVSSVTLLRRALELDPTDHGAVESWQRAARRWLRGGDADAEPGPKLVKPA